MLVMRSGIGWKPGYVGNYKLAPDVDTPIGYACAFAEPVPVSNYNSQTRFRYPDILRVHGCVSSVNVPVRTDSAVFGVLEVDDVRTREFSSDHIFFLAGLANTVAAAIELRRAVEQKERAVILKDLLMQEMQHRIKNNLALVASMLAIQGRRFKDDEIKQEFKKAVGRVHSLAMVHDRLRGLERITDGVAASVFFNGLTEMMRSLVPDGVQLECDAQGEVPGERAESLALITNELVTNSAKYAFPNQRSGTIKIEFCNVGMGWQLTIRDDGIGFPPGFEASTAESFGTRLVYALATQINAKVAFGSSNEGAGSFVQVTAIA
jgi:two-component sensor histidine kinase